MANEDLWILGINMTKFGKHPDKDVVDLAAEAAMAALADGGVTMADMGVLAAGNLMGAAAGVGQQLQKQIGQTGIPVFNVANACATGATAIRTVIMAIKAGECEMGLAVGVEKLSGAGMLGAGHHRVRHHVEERHPEHHAAHEAERHLQPAVRPAHQRGEQPSRHAGCGHQAAPDPDPLRGHRRREYGRGSGAATQQRGNPPTSGLHYAPPMGW